LICKETGLHKILPVIIAMSLQRETMDSLNLFTITAEDKHITFPFRLHRLLEDAPALGFDAIVSWMPSGKAFKVHNTKLFEKEIMNRFFNQTRYKSFLRQLNLYGVHIAERCTPNGVTLGHVNGAVTGVGRWFVFGHR
jgi:hypothetical protein